MPSRSRPLLVVADDATGALEAGALLAESGIATRVHLDPAALRRRRRTAQVVMVPTRHVEPARVYRMIRRAFAATGLPVSAALYWKTDSTLRGPIGACFDALLRIFPARTLVYLPAYPAVGRTVRHGQLLVHGQRLAETEFARDPRNPVTTSSIRDVLASGCDWPVVEVESARQLESTLAGASPPRIIVCDAETDRQLARLATVCRQHSRPLIVAGPAGGIRRWASAECRCRTSFHFPGFHFRGPADRWAVFCGSRHPISRVQAAAAEKLGVEVHWTPAEPAASPSRALRALAAAATRCPGRAFIIFGGDTALAIWRALSISTLEPLGEVLPGVAVSRARSRLFVTKAGGYGHPDIVQEILKKWQA